MTDEREAQIRRIAADSFYDRSSATRPLANALRDLLEAHDGLRPALTERLDNEQAATHDLHALRSRLRDLADLYDRRAREQRPEHHHSAVRADEQMEFAATLRRLL